jgi:hypothetical protein
MKGMNRRFLPVVVLGFACAGNIFSCAQDNSKLQTAKIKRDPDLAHFTKDKRELVSKIAKKHQLDVPRVIWDFFDAAQREDYPSATNLFERVRDGLDQPGKGWVPPQLWGPAHDVLGAFEQFNCWNPKLLRVFGTNIIESIPPGSIYFGGTDAGRFVVSALCLSHTEGQPFYTITQNALADAKYMDYLREIYAEHLYVPDPNELQNAFNDYLKDASERLRTGHLYPDEDVRVVGDRVVAKGVGAIMRINEVLVKLLIEKNPKREIYLEESYPIESLYAQSIPHGLIFRVHHDKMQHVTKSAMEADLQFWLSQTKSLLGKSVQNSTGLAELCAWADGAYVRSNRSGFGGNPAYLEDIQAQQYFSKCRSAQARLYEWRSKNTVDKAESTRLEAEADHAYRQAFALSPFYPETAWRYTQFLADHQRTNDLKLLLATALKSNPNIPVETGSDMLGMTRKNLRNKADELGLGN